MMTMTLPRYELAPWSLQDLLPSTEETEVSNAIANLEQAVSALEGSRSVLSADIDVPTFLAFLEKYETVMRTAYKLAAYASLWFSADTQSQDALGFKGKVDQLMLDAQNRTLFFSLWWKELDDDVATRLMSESGDIAYYLQEMRNFKPYTLSETEEQLINLKDVNGINGVLTLYDMITNKFTFEIEVEGEKQQLTREGLMMYVRHPDPDLRKAAYDELYRVYAAEGTVLAQIYNYRVRDWANEQINLRSFKAPISVR
ncbi:MAG: oligoendopeptidase F, partial [Chloroflexota bacterium]